LEEPSRKATLVECSKHYNIMRVHTLRERAVERAVDGRRPKLTLATAHELQAKVDAVLEVMGQEAHHPGRHHPVQPHFCYTSVITVTKKHLQGER